MYRRSTRQRVVLVALLAATATVITLDFRKNPGGPIRRAQDIAVSVVAPLQDGIGKVFRPIGDFLSSLSQIGSLRDENQRLKAELSGLEADRRRFPEVLRENQRLLDLIGQKDWVQGKTVGARVIGTGPSNQEWTIFLDKGAADGISEDMSVVSAEGLVGRVTLAGSYSKVRLLVDPRHSVGARLTGSGETGVITGSSEDDLVFEHIDPATEISDGETVVTSGYDKGVFPPGIPIGRVTKTQKSRDGLTKTAFVRPFVDFSRLDTVLILLDSGLRVSGR